MLFQQCRAPSHLEQIGLYLLVIDEEVFLKIMEERQRFEPSEETILEAENL